MPGLGLRLFVLGIALVVATTLFAIPGHLTWDSGTYHLMVRGLYKFSELSIPNGYRELSSPLLAVGQTMVRNGSLVAQYPEYYSFLSLPFYALFGFRGLMALNATAFVGICILLWRMAPWFSADRHAPLAAVTVYVFGTYALVFTQSSYPHLTSSFLIFGSAWLVWGAAWAKEEPTSASQPFLRIADLRCALAGALFGVAIGVRLDSVFAGLAIGLPFVTFRTLGWRPLVACGIGGLVTLLGLAWTNAIKFGEFFPFSYGRGGSGGYTSSVSTYLPVAAAIGLAVAALAWHRVRPIRLGHRGIAVVAVAAVLVLAMTSFGQRLLNGVFQIVIDMRIRPDIAEPALSRSPGGAVVYFGNVKKALLESCPYLILIVIPALRSIAQGTYGPRWLLWLVPAGFIGFYGYLAWHGSVGWNMRYLNPTLPFLALLASHELLRVKAHIPTRNALLWVAVTALWCALVLAFLFTQGSLVSQERLILNGGLLLAAVLLAFQTIEWLAPQDLSQKFGKALGAFFVVALVWSFALAVGVDYRVGAAVRSHFLTAARIIQPHIQENALIITFQPDYAWGLLDTGKRPIIANYMLGTPQDAVALVERGLVRHPVYWLSPPQDKDSVSPVVFRELASRQVQAERVFDASPGAHYRLFRLRRTETGRR